jgi:methylenetetrahydrofolate reductase (NADPH)
MDKKRLRQSIRDKSTFDVIVELASGPNFSFAPVEKFLTGFSGDQGKSVPPQFNLVAITATDNSGGTPNLETSDMYRRMVDRGLLGNLDFVPHISCKDRNSDMFASVLAGYKAMGIESMLVITGDKPLKGKRVFEHESVTFLRMIKQMNAEAYSNTAPDNLDSIYQFCAGAAVSPFKYTEASQMQQYYKMEKKIASGAGFLITQLGWDWKKSLELFTYLKEQNLDIPVFGNVFFLSTLNPAARLMNSLKLPGCFVSDSFLKKLNSETLDEQLDRAAQQVAMYKSMGAAGVDIGSVHDYDMFIRILRRAAEIGDNWQQYKDNLRWPQEGGFYLYNDDGSRKSLSRPKKTFSQMNFDMVHSLVLDEHCRGFRIFRGIMSGLGARKGKGFTYRSFDAIERAVKYLMFECEACGDCYLPENFGICTIGKCAKGLANVPCGDATVDGMCGNDLEMRCVGEFVYNAAAAKKALEKWRQTVCPPRMHELEQTPSIINHLFGLDHTASPPLIAIGEAIHSLIPAIGAIMKQLHDLGADAYTKPSGQLEYIKALIEFQALQNAASIAVNVDAFAKDSLDTAKAMIIQYARMVCRWGDHKPICVDSAHPEILAAALTEWYNTPSAVAAPLLALASGADIDAVTELRKKHGFGVVVPVASADNSVESALSSAGTILDKALKHGFKRDEVYFELNAPPLAKDLNEADATAGKTYLSFETIRRIKADKTFKGAHCLMRPGIIAMKLPRGLGILRAYVAKAMEYGLDAAFVDVSKQFGYVPADAQLLELIDAFARKDGAAENKQRAQTMLDDFCQKNEKKKKQPA